MSQPQSIETLCAGVQAELDLIIAFTVLLEEESRILAAGADGEAIGNLAARKSEYADKITAATGSRDAVLSAMGHVTGRAGLDAAALVHPQLAPLAQELSERVDHARDLNAGNGRIIERFVRHNQQTLEVLAHLTGRSKLYDARGRTRPTAQAGGTHIKAG